jgi:hypothetical protein
MRVGYWRDSMSERGTDASKLSIVPGTQQKARLEAGLCVEAPNRREPVANAIS